MRTFVEAVPRYWKAIIAFIAPGAMILLGAQGADTPGEAAITGAEWLTALLTCVVTSASVAAASNQPTRVQVEYVDGEHRAENAGTLSP